MPFISLLDDRARPKGSRDPLGFEAIWTQFGRRMVGNLTTITSLLENFSVAIIGFQLANELGLDYQQVLEKFLRYEQLSAYLRLSAGHKEILGITRVERNWGNNKLNLGTSVAAQILSNQAGYGLWGLYSSAMAATGLVTGEMRKPTAKGRQIAEGFLALNPTMWVAIKQLLDHDTVSKENITSYGSIFVTSIGDPALNATLAEELLGGIQATALQKELNGLMPRYFGQLNHEDNYTRVEPFIGWLINAEKISNELRLVATEIAHMERILASASNLFTYLLSQQNEVLLDDAVARLKSAYSGKHINLVVPDRNFPRKGLLTKYCQAINEENYEAALFDLVSLNREVMLSRGGDAWIEIKENKKLRVRMHAAKAVLPSTPELLLAWQNSYFLPSFLKIYRIANLVSLQVQK